MAITYSCDQCGNEFNFRIKLNRHIATKHGVGVDTIEKSDFDFLQPGRTLTVAEKAKHFDVLRVKFVTI